jgi:hypothetical protein
MDMGTSGYMAFVLDGETKAGYVHNDSCPEGLGADVLDWLRASWQRYEVYALVRSLKVVDDDTAPTPEQIEALKQYANTSVSSKQFDEWYVLLRETQGDPAATLKAGYVYGTHRVEPYRVGYFGEYKYIVDFDTKTFSASGYGRELGRWSFTELPTREAFIAATTEDED